MSNKDIVKCLSGKLSDRLAFMEKLKLVTKLTVFIGLNSSLAYRVVYIYAYIYTHTHS